VHTVDWKPVIERATKMRSAEICAVKYQDKRWESYAEPVVLGCDDGYDYVVKGRQVGRSLINEQVVSALGAKMGAPVAIAKIVMITPELIETSDDLMHLQPGPAHGSRFIDGLHDCVRTDQSIFVQHGKAPHPNRERFFRLAFLYGWIRAHDHQLLYEVEAPHLVHSVDHGHFLPLGPQWNLKSLSMRDYTIPDPQFVKACEMTRDELVHWSYILEDITRDDIAEAVAAAPDEWSVSMDERVLLASFLERRRAELLCAL